MDNQTPLNIKKVVLLLVGAVIFLVLLSWYWNYLHTGKIIITTNKPNSTITLTQVNYKNTGGTTSKSLSGHGKLSVSVGLGQYSASVSDNSQSVTQLIKLGSHKTLRYELNPPNNLTFEPVLNQNAQDVAANNSQLVYLNADTDNVNEINASNSVSVLGSSQLQSVKWASTSYGVGQDGSQNLYVINNNQTSSIKLPFSYATSTTKILRYDLASNKAIYVSYGDDVYEGNQNSSFKKIYSGASSDAVIGASDNKVAVAYEPGSDDDDDGSTQLVVVSSSGQVLKKTSVSDDITDLVWSPNGQYLASGNESTINIYNSSLSLIAVIPTAYTAGGLSWDANNTLFYSIVGKLWSYNLSNSRADLLASAPLDGSISSLAVSSDGSYIYISTLNTITGSNSAILRIGLQGQQASIIADQIQIILPMTLADCTISLVNFSQTPTILIQPSSPQSNLSQSYYIQEAQSQLQQDGFNISQLRFSVD